MERREFLLKDALKQVDDEYDFIFIDCPPSLELLTRNALCAADANTAARIAAIQLAGERGYAEALPILRKALSSPRRDAVLDIVAIGSIGLLGDSSDIPRLSHFIKCDSRRAPAAEAAIRRIDERLGVK